MEVSDDEVRKGKAATLAVEAFLSTPGVLIHAEAVGRDNYGRVLAVFTVSDDSGESRSLASWMRSQGHTR